MYCTDNCTYSTVLFCADRGVHDDVLACYHNSDL